MAAAIPFIVANAGTIASVGSAAVAVGGTAASIAAQRKAERTQDKADKVAKASAEIANQRNIRQNIVRARAAQAQLIAGGQAASGGFSSSPIQGALGASQTQAAANQGFGNVNQAAGGAINALNSQARSAASDAQTFGAVANLPGQFGFDIGSVFKQEKDKGILQNFGGSTGNIKKG